MFRRREDALESDELQQGDILSEAGDEMIDTGANDAAATEDDVTVPPPPFQAQSQTAQAAPQPKPAAAFRAPQTPPNLPAGRSIATSSGESRGSSVGGNPKASKRVLTVGHDIHMKGEISTCDRLVIEGSVDATLKDVHTVELAQTGSFKGTAEIEDAEISGHFEGDLICNGRLIIYATGRVSGNVSYGEIEIERGGQLTGTIKTAEQLKAEQGNKQRQAA